MHQRTEEQLNELIDELKKKLAAAEERAKKAEQEEANIRIQMERDIFGWSVPRPWEHKDLPVPRMEMYWERDDESGYSRRCTHMLVYEHFLSINNIAGKDDPFFLGVPFSQTVNSGSPRKTFVHEYPGEMATIDTPFRDWSHAISDAKQLGLPLFVTTEDGDVSKVVPDPNDKHGRYMQVMIKKGGQLL